MSSTFQPSRSRRWRSLAGAAAAVVAMSGLAACGSDSSGGGVDAANLQLGWFPNVEAMGPIVADDKGYFEDEGIKVSLLPGGPEVTTDAQIVSGNALMGTMSSEALADSVKAGAPLVAVGAIYQTSSSAIVTLADSGITEPKDLEGKRFGVSQTDMRVYEPFFKLTGVDADKVEMVSTGSDPASLMSGEVDAMSGTLANQPIAIQDQGVDTNEIRLADYGYNRWSSLLVVRQDSLEDPEERAAVRALLAAITRGVQDSVEDPDAAAQIVVDEYGEQVGLDLDQQRASAQVWADLSVEGTEEQGVVRLTEEGVAGQQKFFDSIGVEVNAVDLFDLSVQEEEK